MSYVLKNNGVQVAISGGWHPSLFGKITGTSYPAQVTQDYIWEHDDYWLGWEDDPASEPAPLYVPTTVSMRQARLALLQQGLLATVNAAVQSGTDADKITWEYATEVNRSDDLVTNMALALVITETQLNDLFTLAYSL